MWMLKWTPWLQYIRQVILIIQNGRSVQKLIFHSLVKKYDAIHYFSRKYFFYLLFGRKTRNQQKAKRR